MRNLSIYISYLIIVLANVAIMPAGACGSTDSTRSFSIAWKLYQLKETPVNPDHYPYGECFQKAASKYAIPPAVLLAVARGESDFNPRAVSPRSCYGIMQIQWPGTARDLGFTSLSQLYNPCANIDAGAKYLRKMLDRYDNDFHLALAAYNYGPGKIAINSSPWSIPSGANKYSGYIFHHLQEVLDRAAKPLQREYRPGEKIPVIQFDDPRRARNFLAFFKNRAPGLRLDLFKSRAGKTHIVLLAGDANQTSQSIEKMKELGYSVDVNSAFR